MSPYVDPDMAKVLERMRALPPVDLTVPPLAEARALFEENWRTTNEIAVPLPEVRTLMVPTPAGDRVARLYRPIAAGALPVLLYSHGGGWTFGSPASHDRMTRLLALESGMAVLSLDYRLAPEHPFPSSIEDLTAAAAWLRDAGPALGLDPLRWGIGGDSSGASQSLRTLQHLRDENLPLPKAGLLFYGCFEPDFTTESHKLFGDGSWGLTTDRMRWFWRNYLGARSADEAAPGRRSLRGLPPLYLMAAGLDCLRDDTVKLAGKLSSADASFCFDNCPGLIHGSMQLTHAVPAARAALSRAAKWMAAHV
ncbi:MAG: alpha/beta hydrolase [Elsteraceae bacterium]